MKINILCNWLYCFVWTVSMQFLFTFVRLTGSSVSIMIKLADLSNNLKYRTYAMVLEILGQDTRVVNCLPIPLKVHLCCPLSEISVVRSLRVLRVTKTTARTMCFYEPPRYSCPSITPAITVTLHLALFIP